jgi:hypothetical protein
MTDYTPVLKVPVMASVQVVDSSVHSARARGIAAVPGVSRQ